MSTDRKRLVMWSRLMLMQHAAVARQHGTSADGSGNRQDRDNPEPAPREEPRRTV